MDVLVVCNRLTQAERLYWKFVAVCRRDAITFAHNRLQVRYRNYDVEFITKDRLDICKQGRRDPKIIRAADLEAVLDRHYDVYKGENR